MIDVFRKLLALSFVALPILLTACTEVVGQGFPTNNDPANQIRFTTIEEAEARRSQLIKFIWNGGLPAALPTLSQNASLPNLAIGVNPQHIASVDRLDVNVSGWDFHATSYLLHPANQANANRVAIVHQGHANTLEAGVGATADYLLRNGFTVAVMQMPLHGWNTDNVAVIPGRGYFNYQSHGEMIYETAANSGGQGFRLFLEPVVQTINHVVASMPDLEDVCMVGLSGGGWTTSLMAAVDSRIKQSAPVAGSAPLYHRNVEPNAVGDPEQYYAPLYSEAIAADGTGGGAATWLEIYALGGIGAGRKQTLVTNEFDSCCFSGTFPNSFKTVVADKVAGTGSGGWQHFLDSTHQSHQISDNVIDNVIRPLLNITAPVPAPSGLPLVDDFNDQSASMPDGWSVDPSSASGTTVVENEGRMTVAGPGLASVVRTAPFNAKVGLPISIKAELTSISNDNFGGLFVTDEVGSRPHHLGVLFNASTKQLALNADNGGGFSDAGDRIVLGTLPNYRGGAATVTLTFGNDGFAVTFDAGAQGMFDSGWRSWSTIPNGFDVNNLSDTAHLFLQSFDLNGGSAASMTFDAISVTAAPQSADFNGDNRVDGADFLVWQRGFSAPAASHADGDANGDGVVDGNDLLLWKSAMTSGAAASMAIPEPAAPLLHAASCLGSVMLTRRLRRWGKSN